MKNLPLILVAGAAAFFLSKPKSKKTAVKDKPKEKTYPTITATRKLIIDQNLNVVPLKFDLTVDIIPLYDAVDYMKWSKNGTVGLYQDWLTNMLYTQIAISENIWDAYTGELPLVLECGKKLVVTKLDPPSYDIEAFDESQDACFKRLLLGRTLWTDINNYVKDNLPSCPPGAKCE